MGKKHSETKDKVKKDKRKKDKKSKKSKRDIEEDSSCSDFE